MTVLVRVLLWRSFIKRYYVKWEGVGCFIFVKFYKGNCKKYPVDLFIYLFITINTMEILNFVLRH